MIQYKCVVLAVNLTYPNIRNDREYYKNKNDYKIDGKFMRLSLKDQVYNSALSLYNLKPKGLKGPPRGPLKIKELELLDYINSNFSDSYQTEVFPELLNEKSTNFEGIKKQVLVNKYERSSNARQKCIDFHKPICVVCAINFADTYGEIGEGFIHIHHLIPIHKIGKEYKVDYEKDLVPVCPNCHAMLHRKINGIEPTIDELKKIIKNHT